MKRHAAHGIAGLCMIAMALTPELAFAQPAPLAAQQPQTPPLPPPPAPVGPSLADRAWLAPWTTPQASQPSDPLVPTALGELIAGGAMLLTGAVLWGSSTSQTELACGAIAGCFERDTDGGVAMRAAGTSLFGLGLGLAASAGISLAITSASPLEPPDTRDDAAGAVAGHLMTALSIAFFTGGIAYGEGGHTPGDSTYGHAWPLFLVGGVLACVGIPVLATSADLDDAGDRARERLRQQRSSSVLVPTRVRIGAGAAGVQWDY